ncbi:hypothetical protein [Dyella acidiphila]|uniref:Cobalamin ABC transporter n=1 Tax=Dyella acidiphila TaxID=2775866 RepID=A0ABR9GBF5_9GAMM|nr:hypothetical protein [Dyella acidiphila]MBE1161382.1 hypothetical protein [Dyella acidiphila]
MAMTQTQRLSIFAALALGMAATRLHHFNTLPDASWGVFFLAGFWLRGTARWAFPLLMATAVLVDYIVITNMGISFWSHYCVSAGYWFLIPAYGALWLGGSWLAKHQSGLHLSTLAMAVAALLVSENLCYVISNGSFYWLSHSVPTPRSFGAWFENMGDWYLPFLQTTALYVGLGAVLHVLVAQIARVLPHHGSVQH